MGRPPNPEYLRLLKNDKAHQHRYKDKETEVSEMNDIEVPSNLSARAKEIFLDTLEMLEKSYQLCDADIKVLVIYSNNQEQLEALEGYLRVNGVTYVETSMTSERIKERPEVKMHKDCKMLAVKLLEGFKKLPRKPKSTKKNSFADLDEVNG